MTHKITHTLTKVIERQLTPIQLHIENERLIGKHLVNSQELPNFRRR